MSKFPQEITEEELKQWEHVNTYTIMRGIEDAEAKADELDIEGGDARPQLAWKEFLERILAARNDTGVTEQRYYQALERIATVAAEPSLKADLGEQDLQKVQQTLHLVWGIAYEAIYGSGNEEA